MYRIAFFGTPDFSAQILQKLLSLPFLTINAVITQEDRPTGRGKHLTPPPVKKVALDNHLPILQPHSIKKEFAHFLSELTKLGPFDLGIVVAFGQIIPLEILNVPTHGCVNIHTSILPRWRGAAPMQRALMAGDKETGVALMKMEAGLDTGPILAENRVILNPQTTYDELNIELLHRSMDLLDTSLSRILSGELIPQHQSNEGVTYASKITNAECETSFNRPAIEVHNHIRGLSSIPGAFTYLNHKRIKLFRSRVVDTTSLNEKPGTILVADGQSLRIQCHPGEISIEELQLEGKKRMECEEFLRGVVVVKGSHLGK